MKCYLLAPPSNILTFNEPLELLVTDVITAAAPPPFGGNDGRFGLLECDESGWSGSDKRRFRSCMYNSINVSTFVSMSSTCGFMCRGRENEEREEKYFHWKLN